MMLRICTQDAEHTHRERKCHDISGDKLLHIKMSQNHGNELSSWVNKVRSDWERETSKGIGKFKHNEGKEEGIFYIV